MKKFLFLALILIFSNNVFASTTWITKKNSKTSKVKTLEQMYADGLLTRNECIKAKKKILKNQSIPGCKKIETDDESTVTYIAKKKKTKEIPKGPAIRNFKGHIWNGKIVSKKYYCQEALKAGMPNWANDLYTKKGCSEATLIAKKKPKKKKKVDKYVPEETKEDIIKPNIEIASTVTFKDPDYILKGKVTDKGGSEKTYLFYQKGEGKKKLVKLENGKFKIERFSLDNEELKLIAIDEYRNETTKVVKVIIAMEEETEVARIYDKPIPIIKGQKDNKRVAIIIGVENYENTPVKALYANNDAEMFKDFAYRSLGISKSNIKVVIDSNAKKLDIVRTLKLWLPKKITPNQSELFVFFSGHGYPSEDEGLYLIPQDGDPRLLEDSSLSHRYIINLIKKTKPKSVTMFIDACYSGQSRTDEVLIAGLKPIIQSTSNEDVPANFNIFSSSMSSQVSATIREAEHGIFSYYLMKGLSGEADLNPKDDKITNSELYVYLQAAVAQEAFTQNREQNPMLTSENPDQILMEY